jgi:hypothetical protein
MRRSRSQVDSNASAPGEPPLAGASYLRFINVGRRVVAAGVATSGLVLIVSSRQKDYLFYSLHQDPGLWSLGEKISVVCLLVCLTATFLLVLEALARPANVASLSTRTLLLKLASLFGLLAFVWTCGFISYGATQAFVAMAAAMLLVAAVRTQGPSRILFVCFAAALIGSAARLTNHAYHYARWHADEIVAAGQKLMNVTAPGLCLDPSGPSVPTAFRRLGVSRVLVEPDRVAVYHPGIRRTELQIYREPTFAIERVWINRTGKQGGINKITDKLWVVVDN